MERPLKHPFPPLRHIDHVVIGVRNLDEAGEYYQRLGFRVGTSNRHPWGTENRLIQFGSSFIELISVGANANIIPPHARRFSFGAFIRDYLRKQQGLAMLVLSSDDAQRDALYFAENGAGDFEVFSFERGGEAPDGAGARVAFSLAFASDGNAPDVGFFVCQQHFPENFWHSEFQRHANRARNISAVVLTTPAPETHVGFFTTFTGARGRRHPSGGYTFLLENGRIELLRAAVARYLPLHPPSLTSFTVQVDDMREAASILAAENIDFANDENALVVSNNSAFGVEIRLEH